MKRIECSNNIILNISDRERSDLILYPLMVAVVILTYLVIQIYYVVKLFSQYGRDVEFEHMFGVLALLLIGVSLILAIFYLLMVRNSNHSKREASLREAMIGYIECLGEENNVDVSKHVKGMRSLDQRFRNDEKLGNPKKNIFWVMLPALFGFAIMWIPALHDYIVWVIVLCLVMSLIMALVIAPHVTTFPKSHDKRTMEFTQAFCESYRKMGVNLVPTSKSVGYRSFWLFAILTIVTVGFFSIVWIYFVFNDMNRHFEEQWRFEDRLLRSVRSSGLEYVKTKRESKFEERVEDVSEYL